MKIKLNWAVKKNFQFSIELRRYSWDKIAPSLGQDTKEKVSPTAKRSFKKFQVFLLILSASAKITQHARNINLWKKFSSKSKEDSFLGLIPDKLMSGFCKHFTISNVTKLSKLLFLFLSTFYIHCEYLN